MIHCSPHLYQPRHVGGGQSSRRVEDQPSLTHPVRRQRYNRDLRRQRIAQSPKTLKRETLDADRGGLNPFSSVRKAHYHLHTVNRSLETSSKQVPHCEYFPRASSWASGAGPLILYRAIQRQRLIARERHVPSDREPEIHLR